MKRHTGHVLNAVDPTAMENGPGLGYGVKQAAEGAVRHIELAAASDGASQAVTTHATHVATSARNTVARAEEVASLAAQIMAATSAARTAPLVAQLNTLAEQLVAGHDANGDGRLDSDPSQAAHVPEDTGLNRILGQSFDDSLYGGTNVDFLYGNGGHDTLFRADGSPFESLDGGVAGDAWKEFARESNQVWYVSATNADDENPAIRRSRCLVESQNLLLALCDVDGQRHIFQVPPRCPCDEVQLRLFSDGLEVFPSIHLEVGL